MGTSPREAHMMVAMGTAGAGVVGEGADTAGVGEEGLGSEEEGEAGLAGGGEAKECSKRERKLFFVRRYGSGARDDRCPKMVINVL